MQVSGKPKTETLLCLYHNEPETFYREDWLDKEGFLIGEKILIPHDDTGYYYEVSPYAEDPLKMWVTGRIKHFRKRSDADNFIHEWCNKLVLNMIDIRFEYRKLELDG